MHPKKSVYIFVVIPFFLHVLPHAQLAFRFTKITEHILNIKISHRFCL